MAQCILCGYHQTSIIEKIDTQLLQKLYKKLSIDTYQYIQTPLFYHHCLECDFRFYALENGEIPTGDNDFYNSINKFPWYYFSEKYEYAYAQKWIIKDHQVVEVGCGKAAFAKYIPYAHYMGLELSTDAKIMAQKNGVEIENISIQNYAQQHPESSDIVCSFQVLEHVSNPHSFLQSQVKTLRGGGYLYLQCQVKIASSAMQQTTF